MTIVAAVVLLGLNSNGKIKGDAAIAMISVGALALGYLLLNVFQTASNVSGDVCSTLFGSTSILTLSVSDVWLCVGLAILVILTFVIFYHKIFAVTFDEEFARATGTNVRAYNILIAVVTAVVIVLAMNLVGALLISALIISRPLGDAGIQELPSGHGKRRRYLGALLRARDPRLRHIRHPRRLDDSCRRHCGIRRILTCGQT